MSLPNKYLKEDETLPYLEEIEALMERFPEELSDSKIEADPELSSSFEDILQKCREEQGVRQSVAMTQYILNTDHPHLKWAVVSSEKVISFLQSHREYIEDPANTPEPQESL